MSPKSDRDEHFDRAPPREKRPTPRHRGIWRISPSRAYNATRLLVKSSPRSGCPRSAYGLTLHFAPQRRVVHEVSRRWSCARPATDTVTESGNVPRVARWRDPRARTAFGRRRSPASVRGRRVRAHPARAGGPAAPCRRSDQPGHRTAAPWWTVETVRLSSMKGGQTWSRDAWHTTARVPRVGTEPAAQRRSACRSGSRQRRRGTRQASTECWRPGVPAGSSTWLRSAASARLRIRDTCICDTPICAAISLWVMSWVKRRCNTR